MYLNKPSGSNGPWHHTGASSRNAPVAGELKVQACRLLGSQYMYPINRPLIRFKQTNGLILLICYALRTSGNCNRPLALTKQVDRKDG